MLLFFYDVVVVLCRVVFIVIACLGVGIFIGHCIKWPLDEP